MAPFPLQNDDSPRLRPSTLDGLVAALTPALIIGMISCLVFFLVLVVYQGIFTERLMYILGLYTFAIVLVARIAIEQSRAVAFGYTLLLGAATFFVTMRFVSFPPALAPLSPFIIAGFLILIGVLADRITFDCTLIDEAEDGSGVGLLQSLGVLANPETHSKTSSGSTEQADSKSQTIVKKKKKSHNPGVWVLYFALMAIPLFGLGQLMIPAADEASRRSAFFCLFGYLFFSLSLLVVTSFLSMRRYLRKRNVAMPPKLSFVWIASGILGMLTMLCLIALIPLPNGSLGLADLPFKITSSEQLNPSEQGWGHEGVPQQKPADQKKVDETTQSKEVTQSDGKSKNQKDDKEGTAQSNQSKDDKNAQSDTQTNGSEKGEAFKQSKQSKSTKNQNEDSSKQVNESKKPVQQPNETKKENKSAQGNPSPQYKEDVKKDQQKAPTRDKKPEESEPTNTPKENPTPPPQKTPQSPSQNYSLSLSGGLANLLRWLISLILLGLIGYWLIRYRHEFLAAWRDFKAWWRQLFKSDGQTASIAKEASETVVAVPLKSFHDFSNPFESKDTSLTATKVIQHTFEAIEAWGREHGAIRSDRETPQEYLQRLMALFPDQKNQFHNLAQIYNRLAYAGGRTSSQEITPLRELWSWLKRTAAVCCLFATLILPMTTIAEEHNLDFRSFWIPSVDSNIARGKKPSAFKPEIDRDSLRSMIQKRLSRDELAREWSANEAAGFYRELMRWHWLGDGSIREAKVLPLSATVPLKFDLQSRIPRPHSELGWPAGYTQVSSPHFLITTQASSQLAVEVAKLCEQTYSVWQQLFFEMWSDAPSLQSAIQSGQHLALPQGSNRFEVVLFRDRESYLKQLARMEPNVAVSTGYYSPKLRRVFCYWDAASSEATLRHELSHQFFQEGSRSESVDPSLLPSDFWIIEGLALYMESIRIEKGANFDQAMIGGWDAARLQPARYRRLHDQTWIDWNEFRAGNNERFRGGEAIKIWYSQAAGLTHLWMDSQADSRQAMIRYAQSVLKGSPVPAKLHSWNDDETLRTAYDQFLLNPNQEHPWQPQATVRDVVLSRCNVDSSTLLSWPATFRRLEWLDLSFTRVDDSLFIDTTMNNPQAVWDVRRLNVESTQVTDRALTAIAKMPRLEELDLSNNAITDDGVRALLGNRTIKTLWLNGNTKITDASLEVLSAMLRLEQIDVQGTAISEAGWEKLLKKSPKLRRKRS
jgi:Domain of unknown function (DUF4129)/Leucine Rich repeat